MHRVFGTLPAAPVLTVTTAVELIDRSFQAANQVVDRLVVAGVLVQINVDWRTCAFEAPELIDAFTELERQLANGGQYAGVRTVAGRAAQTTLTVPTKRRTELG